VPDYRLFPPGMRSCSMPSTQRAACSGLAARADRRGDRIKIAAMRKSGGTKRTYCNDLPLVRFSAQVDIRQSRWLWWCDAIDPACVKTHTIAKCRKYNSPTRYRTSCAQHDSTPWCVISSRCFYVRGGRWSFRTAKTHLGSRVCIAAIAMMLICVGRVRDHRRAE
jgi:hypothetical protein